MRLTSKNTFMILMPSLAFGDTVLTREIAG